MKRRSHKAARHVDKALMCQGQSKRSTPKSTDVVHELLDRCRLVAEARPDQIRRLMDDIHRVQRTKTTE